MRRCHILLVIAFLCVSQVLLAHVALWSAVSTYILSVGLLPAHIITSVLAHTNSMVNRSVASTYMFSVGLLLAHTFCQ